ncbi:nuclear transport factor 2 family protein [Actinomadura sp. WMMB 499]|uniref:nuclear transport factor 2 family protein n=1 Tax=Actinomadura sp. WMMB 499 TaxID=1219491 RepID=UPI0012441B02|nr:nuclear transport factor 2 family protein [Actinomadura sp. WMMB 499]QFG23205.1 nuclear transport factor 2 family protein [Actinomadura sp. WMMB 499]
MDPEQTLRHAMDLLLKHDFDGFARMWAEDAVMEFPFAPADAPGRLEGGAVVAAYMRDYPNHIDLQAIPYLEIHRTETPGRVVAEMRATGRVVGTGEPYEMSYIAVIDIEDGRFVRYRDYWNPLKMPDSMRGAA